MLDEPIAGLDPVQIVEMRELVRSLRHEHTTIISSHILSEISETCDRILVIRDGEIVASGTEAELSSASARGRRVGDHGARRRGAQAQARSSRRSKACTTVEHVDAAEPGDDVATFQVDADARRARGRVPRARARQHRRARGRRAASASSSRSSSASPNPDSAQTDARGHA